MQVLACDCVRAFASMRACTRGRCASVPTFVCVCVGAYASVFFRECGTMSGYRQLGKNKNSLTSEYKDNFSVPKLRTQAFFCA